MDEHGFLFNALMYLAAAVIAVIFAKRMGLGSVLGYLIAGIIIGPWGLRIITNVDDILHFAEFGVVLLLFIIGLELNPKRLWSMRKPIIGIGGTQVLLTTVVIFALALLFKLPWNVALVAAMGLSLSSTAIALQTLTEKNLLSTPAGNAGFSTLLFQDIAVIPMLALIPLLGASPEVSDGTNSWLATLKVIAAITFIVAGGRYLIRPVFRTIANARSREIFTAFSLLLVIGIALLMQAVNMAMALGTFLAGVLLAESEYRHQLEADIEPFKGLLLGLFFISVGMSIDFGLLLNNPTTIIILVVLLIVFKMAVLYGMGRYFKIPPSQNFFFAALLSQGGEFAFVLFGVATDFAAMDNDIAGTLILVVALSMLLTPLLLIINDNWIEPRFANLEEEPKVDIQVEDSQVIIAGFGRFGQIVARLLHANKIPTTIIDHNPNHIERVKKFGFKVFYGDVTRVDLLRAAEADKAKLIVMAIDDHTSSQYAIKNIKKHFPHLTILSRAWDLLHAYDLMDQGIDLFERETFDSALHLGEKTLQQLGYGAHRAHRAAQKFRIHDLDVMTELHKIHKDQEQAISLTQAASKEIERLFATDERMLAENRERGWD